MTRERKTKPYPWRCPKCLKREVCPSTIEYTTRVKYEGRLYDVTIPEFVVPTCGVCGELVFCNDTDERITRALREKLGLLHPDEIRTGRAELGLTQKALAKQIGVAQETISRWESGLLIQSRAMNNLLNLYFNLPNVRDVLGAGFGSLESADILTGWVNMSQTALFTSTDVFLDSITDLWAMTDVQIVGTPVLEVPIVPQEQTHE